MLASVVALSHVRALSLSPLAWVVGGRRRGSGGGGGGGSDSIAMAGWASGYRSLAQRC